MSDLFEIDPELPRSWTPAAQEKYLEAMASAAKPQAWFCKHPGRSCDGAPHGAYDYHHARADQWPPPMDDPSWSTWVLLGGRGAGKTRSGAEWVRHMTRYTGRLVLIAPTAADLRDTMIEGESGIRAVCDRAGYLPVWEGTKRRLTFPNGAIAIGYTAEEPDRLRGPNAGAAWVDEAAHYPNVQYVWDMLRYGMRRVELTPRTCVTTTPTPSPWLRDLLALSTTRIARASTFANAANLAPAYLKEMREKYAGTRQGRQELYAEILEDVEGAMWSGVLLDATRVKVAPHLARVAVGVDPAGSSTARSDETGIVVVGLGVDGHLYVLADYSGRFTPHEWAAHTFAAAADFEADVVVAEHNYGGEMVRNVLDTTGRPQRARYTRIKTVSSRKGKLIRAEPVFSLFEQGRAHLAAHLGELEAQLCSWVPGAARSPDRLDAMVHACLELTGAGGAAIAVPRGLIPRPSPLRPGRGSAYSDLRKMARGVLYGR